MNLDLGLVGIWSPSPRWEHSSELASAAAELEELGYGALWLGSSRGDLELPATLLASTRRLVVATAIINVWTSPASELAARYAHLQRESPDRLLIGLGTSHAPLVEPAGFSYRHPLRRLANNHYAGWQATSTSSTQASRRSQPNAASWASSGLGP
jgi:alkanesulfonate monooxygenase SsuD/methylene tetrahydromethanopterin reductase-like flavin-dependent oxidoreductase (luciferase family)